ncbi:TRAP transporter small permease [Vreelandella populi]|uniref:TRAP transporter small permease protein n=2 Tax=Vreelandella populi TaxID=2498858 RepID=A0A3S0YXD8_9GAMM|nr:TRAP transporter small permease [Halomonas populi]
MISLNRLIRTISSIQLDLAAVAAALILLQVMVDLVLRYVFDSPIRLSTEIVAYYYLVALVFLPLLAVEYHDHHIATDLFFSHFPRGLQESCLILGSIMSIALYLCLAWFSLDAAIDATQKREVIMGARLLPIWPMRWLLPFAFLMASFGAVLTMIRRITEGPEATGSADPKESFYE